MYRKSNWTYNTGASVVGSIGAFSAASGMLVLNDPSGARKRFNFSTFGMGIGARLPKAVQLPDIPLPKGHSLSGSGSTTEFWGDGVVFMNRTFPGSELSISDFCGGAFTADFGAGVLIAKSYTAMHVGIPIPIIQAATFNPAFAGLAVNSAKAIILMKGISEGLIGAVSGSSSIGAITYGGIYSE